MWDVYVLTARSIIGCVLFPSESLPCLCSTVLLWLERQLLSLFMLVDIQASLLLIKASVGLVKPLATAWQPQSNVLAVRSKTSLSANCKLHADKTLAVVFVICVWAWWSSRTSKCYGYEMAVADFKVLLSILHPFMCLFHVIWSDQQSWASKWP